jgi:hypothetical protein
MPGLSTKMFISILINNLLAAIRLLKHTRRHSSASFKPDELKWFVRKINHDHLSLSPGGLSCRCRPSRRAARPQHHMPRRRSTSQSITSSSAEVPCAQRRVPERRNEDTAALQLLGRGGVGRSAAARRAEPGEVLGAFAIAREMKSRSLGNGHTRPSPPVSRHLPIPPPPSLFSSPPAKPPTPRQTSVHTHCSVSPCHSAAPSL